jgi:hypothetical protein
VIQFRRSVRLGKTSNRLPFPLAARRASHSFKQTLTRVLRVMAPTLVALSFAGVAHAQGTMDFSGAQTLMGTFKRRSDSRRCLAVPCRVLIVGEPFRQSKITRRLSLECE